MDPIYKEYGFYQSTQLSVVVTIFLSQLQHDQTLPLSVKGVAWETSYIDDCILWCIYRYIYSIIGSYPHGKFKYSCCVSSPPPPPSCLTWSSPSGLGTPKTMSLGPPGTSDVLDMPVDPNEPTYCLCHQVRLLNHITVTVSDHFHEEQGSCSKILLSRCHYPLLWIRAIIGLFFLHEMAVLIS